MNHKLLYPSIALMTAGVVGIIFAVSMEIVTGEPVYWLIMKVTAALFGVGGPLLGIVISRRARKK